MTLHTNWHTNLQKTSLNISVSCHIFYFSNSIFLRWSNACFFYIYFNHVINKLPESKQKVKSKHCLTTTRSNLLFNYFYSPQNFSSLLPDSWNLWLEAALETTRKLHRQQQAWDRIFDPHTSVTILFVDQRKGFFFSIPSIIG